jgi:mRNA interferase MazF
MTLHLGEVVLIRMRFHQAPGSKVTPAVALLDTGDDDFVAAPVTSQFRPPPYDLQIGDWRAAGLNVPSSVRIHKLAVLPKADVVRSVGHLSPSARQSVREVLCRAFCSPSDES